MEKNIKNEYLIEGKNIIYEYIKAGNSLKKLYVIKGSRDEKINYIVETSKKTNTVISFVDRAFLDLLSESKNHKGIIAEVSCYKYFELNEVVDNLDNEKKIFAVILDEIEDPHNLGAIIRSAVLFGVDFLIIKNRNACQVNSTVISSSSGATSYMKVVRVENISKTIAYLKTKNFWVYGLDLNGDDIKNENFANRTCLVIGNEGSGISRLVRENCDKLVNIKTTQVIDSLNVSVATGIAMFNVYNKMFC